MKKIISLLVVGMLLAGSGVAVLGAGTETIENTLSVAGLACDIDDGLIEWGAISAGGTKSTVDLLDSQTVTNISIGMNDVVFQAKVSSFSDEWVGETPVGNTLTIEPNAAPESILNAFGIRSDSASGYNGAALSGAYRPIMNTALAAGGSDVFDFTFELSDNINFATENLSGQIVVMASEAI